MPAEAKPLFRVEAIRPHLAVCSWPDGIDAANLRETRLCHKGHDQFTFERFETARLADDENELKRFLFLLGAERVAPATVPIAAARIDNIRI